MISAKEVGSWFIVLTVILILAYLLRGFYIFHVAEKKMKETIKAVQDFKETFEAYKDLSNFIQEEQSKVLQRLYQNKISKGEKTHKKRGRKKKNEKINEMTYTEKELKEIKGYPT